MKIKEPKIFKRKAKGDRRQGKWVLRFEYFDEIAGKFRSRERQFDKRSDAIDARPEMEAEIRKTYGQIAAGEKMSFWDLTEVCKRQFYKPAVIREGRKIDGVRSYIPTCAFIDSLNEFFGKRRIGQITSADLKNYKKWRLDRGSKRGKGDKFVPVSLTLVNRELATMRRMMKHAYSQGWTSRDIFEGAKVIDTDAEVERVRRLSDSETALLLASCQGTRQIAYKRKINGIEKEVISNISVDNPYLKGMILLALDSALRKGEILKLTWEDVDFVGRKITIKGTHTKTERSRLVPLSERAKSELLSLPSYGKNDRVFPLSDFKRSWKTAKAIAGITDLRFHDLRRTAITQFNLTGIPLAIAGKIAGHARLETTMKHYVSTDEDIVREVTEKIDARHFQKGGSTGVETDYVN